MSLLHYRVGTWTLTGAVDRIGRRVSAQRQDPGQDNLDLDGDWELGQPTRFGEAYAVDPGRRLSVPSHTPTFSDTDRISTTSTSHRR